MRRRLDLAVAFIQSPQVFFMDEPTAGLDPRNRNMVWAEIRRLVAGGSTVLLTTQHLDEADQLANRIALMDRGRVIAEGSPKELKSRIGGDQIEVALTNLGQLRAAIEIVQSICGEAVELNEDTRTITAPVVDRVSVLVETARRLEEAGIDVQDIGLRQPTLDEVFLRLTAKEEAA